MNARVILLAAFVAAFSITMMGGCVTRYRSVPSGSKTAPTQSAGTQLSISAGRPALFGPTSRPEILALPLLLSGCPATGCFSPDAMRTIYESEDPEALRNLLLTIVALYGSATAQLLGSADQLNATSFGNALQKTLWGQGNEQALVEHILASLPLEKLKGNATLLFDLRPSNSDRRPINVVLAGDTTSPFDLEGQPGTQFLLRQDTSRGQDPAQFLTLETAHLQSLNHLWAASLSPVEAARALEDLPSFLNASTAEGGFSLDNFSGGENTQRSQKKKGTPLAVTAATLAFPPLAVLRQGWKHRFPISLLVGPAIGAVAGSAVTLYLLANPMAYLQQTREAAIKWLNEQGTLVQNLAEKGVDYRVEEGAEVLGILSSQFSLIDDPRVSYSKSDFVGLVNVKEQSSFFGGKLVTSFMNVLHAPSGDIELGLRFSDARRLAGLASMKGTSGLREAPGGLLLPEEFTTDSFRIITHYSNEPNPADRKLQDLAIVLIADADGGEMGIIEVTRANIRSLATSRDANVEFANSRVPGLGDLKTDIGDMFPQLTNAQMIVINEMAETVASPQRIASAYKSMSSFLQQNQQDDRVKVIVAFKEKRSVELLPQIMAIRTIEQFIIEEDSPERSSRAQAIRDNYDRQKALADRYSEARLDDLLGLIRTSGDGPLSETCASDADTTCTKTTTAALKANIQNHMKDMFRSGEFQELALPTGETVIIAPTAYR